MPKTIICPNCGTLKQLRPNRPERYCSLKCARKHRHQTRRLDSRGRWLVWLPDYPHKKRTGDWKEWILEHVVVAEKALGKALPSNAVVHHHDRNYKNNVNSNLVICQDKRYHNMLHQRIRIAAFGADPNTERVCRRCGLVGQISEFYECSPTMCKPCKG